MPALFEHLQKRVLMQYVLQRYQIDPHKVQSRASAQQIVVANLEELGRWLYS